MTAAKRPSLLGGARPHRDLACVAAAFTEGLALGDFPRGARFPDKPLGLRGDRAAGVAKGLDHVAIPALAEGLGFRRAPRREIHRVAERARLAVVGDRAPELLLAGTRAVRVGREQGKSKHHPGDWRDPHSRFYLTRTRMARSSPSIVVGYMRPPMISRRIAIDCR